MSTQDTRKVVSRTVMDQGFRALLFSNPEQALAGYDLTADEVAALRAIPAETIDDFANHLDERISMSVLAYGYDAFGGAVMGGDASGGAVAGSQASGGDAMGGMTYGSDAYGNDAYGGQVSGGAVAGSQASGGDVMGGAAYGNDAHGGQVSGGVVSGSQAFGGDAMGGAAAGGGENFAGGDRPVSWLARLSEALGVQSTGNAPKGVNYY